MSRRTVFAMLMVVVSMALLVAMAGEALAQDNQGGRGGRGGRGMMGDMYYLERTWTMVSFQVEATPEQIAALSPILGEALTERNELIQAAIEAEDFESVRTAITDCKTALETALQEQLTDEQWTKVQELLEMRMVGRRGGQDGGAPPAAN